MSNGGLAQSALEYRALQQEQGGNEDRFQRQFDVLQSFRAVLTIHISATLRLI
jgi:hypothetical protein